MPHWPSSCRNSPPSSRARRLDWVRRWAASWPHRWSRRSPFRRSIIPRSTAMPFNSTISTRRGRRGCPSSAAPLPAGAIYDSNRFTLAALLGQVGCAVGDLGILPDRREEVQRALAAAASDHDSIITSGGVSVGEEDHVKSAVLALGRLHVWRLAIKPGRPIALGQIEDGSRQVPFIGLPGNPVAAMVTFLRVVRPILLRIVDACDAGPRAYR